MARVSTLAAVRLPRRVATLSVHTSPLEQAGTGDAGGMNVYIVEVAKRLAQAGVEVEIFTRATRSGLPATVEMAPGVLVRHVVAGPFEGLAKEELPAQLCAFTNGVLRAEAARSPGWYDLVHSHYWLSGQVGWLAKDRWGVPLVHTAHTLAKVKNRQLADGDRPEPKARVIGEEQVIAEADRLVANTPSEARELIDLYGAPEDRVTVVEPGVDLDRFAPASVGREDAARSAARRRLGLPTRGHVIAFVGRIQPLKAPDILLRAAADLPPDLRDQVTLAIVGGNSGSGLDLAGLAAELGVAGVVRFLPPQDRQALPDVYRAADLVAVPSYNESFGLVALEAQACGTPVVAAAVGGLRTAVRDGRSGVLVDGHDPVEWARVMSRLLRKPNLRALLAKGAIEHARQFSWNHTAASLLAVYRDAVTGYRSQGFGFELATAR
ncbi:D-inositol-3-phosphate glycosyltransferase [Rugosimonospora africana]|uniref:D-inositol-3-phosphate glycosyltransferase n=1 Tax=Rugosimonospora africana TaxID=556532 RepID=A0A8J3VMU2_9ACTN|nr:D-inositol-3-phosphate glycosyltransferase [Rugosimonospora africana]GIH12325.1 D-inositol 3-phosphate glycosyltransferase [Rugosimonospora africana]